jgi:hypothetical protein
MKLTEDELLALENAETEKVWNALCDQIKKRCGRQYPEDWRTRVLATGLAYRKQELFRLQ